MSAATTREKLAAIYARFYPGDEISADYMLDLMAEVLEERK